MERKAAWKRGVTVTPSSATDEANAPQTVDIRGELLEAVNRFVKQNAPAGALEVDARVQGEAAAAKPVPRHPRQGVGAKGKPQRDLRDLTKPQRMLARAAGGTQAGGAGAQQSHRRKRTREKSSSSSSEADEGGGEGRSGAIK